MTTADVRVRVGVGAMAPPRSSPPLPAPPLPDSLDLNDRTLFAVYCFIKNFIGASGASAVAIDNKIEQAMDLVKSHLMFAVREEVEVLKDKIAELMDRINQLELENSILKAHATQETLEQLVTAPKPTLAAGGGSAGTNQPPLQALQALQGLHGPQQHNGSP